MFSNQKKKKKSGRLWGLEFEPFSSAGLIRIVFLVQLMKWVGFFSTISEVGLEGVFYAKREPKSC